MSDELRAKHLAAAFGLGFADALAHIHGGLRLTVPTEDLTALTFADPTEALAAHAILSKAGVFAVRTEEPAGRRLWIRWAEPPEPRLVVERFGRLLGGLDYRIAVEGETLAPLWSGGRTWGPDGRTRSWTQLPKTSLAPLARRLNQEAAA